MRQLLYGTVAAVLVGALGGFSLVLAHGGEAGDFGDEHHEEIYQDTGTQAAIIGDDPLSEEQLQRYNTALEALRQRFQEEAGRQPVVSASPLLLPTASPGLFSPLPVPFLDSDADGLTDVEEARLTTDPVRADSDGDGSADGEERAGARNPLKAAPDDQVVFTRASFAVMAPFQSDLTITGIRHIPSAEGDTHAVTGTGPTRMYVTIFVASAPHVAIVRTDDTGRFRVVLHEPLSDGQHEAFVAFIGSDGHVVERSTPFVFEKRGEEILLQHSARLKTDDTVRFPWSSALIHHTELIALAFILTGASLWLLGIEAWMLVRFRGRSSAGNSDTRSGRNILQ